MGQTQPWTNPHSSGQVACSASGLNASSEPILNLCGRTSLRLVSTDAAGSWMKIDLLQHRIKLTAYTLRHYSSWDTEALRSWKLEGSMDGNSWITLMNHENDSTLNKKGQAHTWNVPNCNEFYRFFRIYLTGQNSNNHNYLACSGLELFGSAKGGIISAGSDTPPPQGPFRRFVHQSDFDDNGILHWLGTKAGTTGWTNPAESGLVSVTSSELMGNSTPITAICGKELVRCVTQEKVNAFWMLDFKNMRINPTHYTLKHYASWNIEALRNWKLEGKVCALSMWIETVWCKIANVMTSRFDWLIRLCS